MPEISSRQTDSSKIAQMAWDCFQKNCEIEHDRAFNGVVITKRTVIERINETSSFLLALIDMKESGVANESRLINALESTFVRLCRGLVVRQHEVRYDPNLGSTRYTSDKYTCFTCQESLFKSITVTERDWQKQMENFFTLHPFKNAGERMVKGTCPTCNFVRHDILSEDVEWYCPECGRFQISVKEIRERK